MITIIYNAVDGYRSIRTFGDLRVARAFAYELVGKHAEFGTGYAVSNDGVGKVQVRGITLHKLFEREE